MTFVTFVTFCSVPDCEQKATKVTKEDRMEEDNNDCANKYVS